MAGRMVVVLWQHSWLWHCCWGAVLESDLFSFDLTILDLNFVTAQDDRDVLADSGQITVPVRNILVGNTRGDIEHDNGALSLDVVSVTESSKLFLSGGIPNIEFDGTTVGVESQGMHLYPQSCYVFLFEFSSQVTLDESSLANTTVTDEDKLEFWSTCESLRIDSHCRVWKSIWIGSGHRVGFGSMTRKKWEYECSKKIETGEMEPSQLCLWIRC